MTKLTTILLAGVATLAFTGCGSSSSSTGGTTPPVEDTTTIPLSVNGNQILVPGYTYDIRAEDVVEIYVAEAGNVLLSGDHCKVKAFDENFNAYELSVYANESIIGDTEYYEAGMYYLTVGNQRLDICTVTVQSNVLIVPQY